MSSRKRRVRLKLGVIESERYEACKFSFAQLGSWPGCRRVTPGAINDGNTIFSADIFTLYIFPMGVPGGLLN